MQFWKVNFPLNHEHLWTSVYSDQIRVSFADVARWLKTCTKFSNFQSCDMKDVLCNWSLGLQNHWTTPSQQSWPIWSQIFWVLMHFLQAISLRYCKTWPAVKMKIELVQAKKLLGSMQSNNLHDTFIN